MSVGRELERGGAGTEMMGSWPLIPTMRDFFLMTTFRSFPFRFPGISAVTSSSPICWVHL